MHISFYKRPLFILLVLYALCLCVFLKTPEAPQQALISMPSADMEAVITSYPRSKKETKLFQASLLTLNGKPHNLKAYVHCSSCEGLERGQKISFKGSLSTVKAVDNFGSFNWAKFLARKQIFNEIKTEGIDNAQTFSVFWVSLSKVRNSILTTFESRYDASLLPILSGITIGEKGDIDQALYTAFQDSGAMHLLVASGGNVGFVTLIVYFICSLFGAGRKTSAVFALSLAGFYTLIAGADAPLLRAYLMTISATIGFMLGRKSGVLQGFVIAALIILIVNPQSLFEAGFQMSFLATLSIILLVSNFKMFQKMSRLPRFVLQLFFVSLIAQLSLLPVFTNYFYKVSFTAAASNILLVPLSGIIMAGGFIVWLASFIPVDFVFNILSSSLELLLWTFKILVEFFADFRLSKIVASALKPTTIIVYFIVLFTFLNRPIVKSKIIYTLFWSWVIIFVLLIGCFNSGRQTHVLEGRYNKALFVKEKGKVKIIGAGIQGDILKKAVLASGSKKIDCLFLNGVSKSNIYGLNDFKDIKIKRVYLPYNNLPKESQAAISSLKAKGTMIWPGEEHCGVKAVHPWFILDDGDFYINEASGQNLSYIFKDYHTSGNMKEILSQKEFNQIYKE